MTVIIKKLTKDIHFPVVQAIPDEEHVRFWEKVKKFLFYRRQWEVVQNHAIWSPFFHRWIFLPKGFVYDGASVPKVLHSLLGPTGILLLGSGPHDEGYKYAGLIFFRPVDKGISKGLEVEGDLVFQLISKFELDRMFRSLCKRESSLGVSTLLATLSVMIFGIFTWRGYREKGSGITSLCKDFPDIKISLLQND